MDFTLPNEKAPAVTIRKGLYLNSTTPCPLWKKDKSDALYHAFCTPFKPRA